MRYWLIATSMKAFIDGEEILHLGPIEVDGWRYCFRRGVGAGEASRTSRR